MDSRPFPVSLSLVIPAYNEADGIAVAIHEADDALARLGYDYEILVVDDGSTDKTAQVAQQASAGKPRVRILRHDENRGYGAALRTGFQAASGDLVAFTDADCQFYLEDLDRLVRLTETAPVAVGARQHRQDPWLRRFCSWGYNVLARTLLGTRVRDCDCALKVFDRRTLHRLLPESQGYFVNAEMLTRARQLGLAVAETAVRHRPRRRGRSKVSLRDVPRTLRTFLPFWWSEVLFPTSGSPADSTAIVSGSAVRRVLLQSLLLAVCAGLLFFTRLSAPLLEPEEARYAEIPRQMLAEGSFVVPLLHGEPYYHKPPLLYWLVMASYCLFGVHDWAARLVPGSAALLMVLLIYLWGRRPLGDRAAFLGALIVCLSARYLYLGRMLTTDGLLTLWTTAAFVAAVRAVLVSERQRVWWVVSALASGLGVLTKGPIALVLVAVPTLAFQLLDSRAARPTLRAWASYIGLALAVTLPWYVSMAALHWQAFVDFFWVHHIVRYLDPLDHPEPVWFFLPSLAFGMLPWSLLLLPLARDLLRSSTTAAGQRTPALGYFLLAFLWAVLFFSGSGCKRAVYILPALPLMAITVGSYLSAALDWRAVRCGNGASLPLPASHGRFARCVIYGALTAGIVLAVAALHARLWDTTEGALIAAFLCGLLAVAVHCGKRLSAPASWLACVGALFLIQLGAVYHLLPDYNRRFSLRGQVRRQLQRPLGQHLPVLCYPRGWDSVRFYLRRDDVAVYGEAELREMIERLKEEQRALLFVKRDGPLRRFLSALPGWLEFIPDAQQRGNVVVGMVRPRQRQTEPRLVHR